MKLEHIPLNHDTAFWGWHQGKCVVYTKRADDAGDRNSNLHIWIEVSSNDPLGIVKELREYLQARKTLLGLK